ncbi:uncharacterized protein G2W53_009374 [Senna tora]|uniref:Uncharacterized protein n=1 Tax=Senna tora TaxID=362788 RepID=A0A834WXD1_9FABA|nr:uncharacterized protein G2W53_009374 [Senna tora]
MGAVVMKKDDSGQGTAATVSSSSFSFLYCRLLSPSTVAFHLRMNLETLINRSLWLLLPSNRHRPSSSSIVVVFLLPLSPFTEGRRCGNLRSVGGGDDSFRV